MRAETVGDRMERGVFVCDPETPAEEAAATMASRDVSALVVVDATGLAIGVVSRTDLADVLITRAVPDPWHGLSVGAIMSRPVVSVHADTPLAEATRRLRQAGVHRLVVTRTTDDGEKPIGILSVSDLVKPPPRKRRSRSA